MNPLLIGPVAQILNKTLDLIFPNPKEKIDAQIRLVELEQNGQLKELEANLSAILAEAQSTDPWTSRARPSFMYLFYMVILSMVVVAPVIGIFFPESMDLFFLNVDKGFKAIPEALWWTFSAGYLGYGGYRTYEKKLGVTK